MFDIRSRSCLPEGWMSRWDGKVVWLEYDDLLPPPLKLDPSRRANEQWTMG